MWNDTSNVETIDWQAAYEESDRINKERWAKEPPVIKGFYEEHDEVKRMAPEEVQKFRTDNNNIVISHFRETDESPLPNPAPTFEHSFHNHPDILAVIRKQGFEKPSPIQTQAWPVLLQGKDLIGIAQTGTGKTLAYLLPGLLAIDKQTTPLANRHGPSMLVLAPTRELAQQIDRETNKYSYHNIKSLCIYGGGDRREQIRRFKADKPEVIIATPGRLNDLTYSDNIDLTSVVYLVLDEADRMLDMGFMPQIRKILSECRPDRQSVMMSATWPPGVRKIATDFMMDPIQVFVGSLDLAAVNSVSQEIVLTEPDQKRRLLMEFIVNTMGPKDKAIVFVSRKFVADDISSDLALSNIPCDCMHGDRDQEDRERALADLKSGATQLIIATDVASRGLDIDDITYILNYDFPNNTEEYVHRVGRTGRAGRTGKSITFFTRDDWSHAKELIDILEKSDNPEIPKWLVDMSERYKAWYDKKKAEDMAAGRLGGGGGRGGRRYGDRDGFGGGGGGGGGPRSSRGAGGREAGARGGRDWGPMRRTGGGDSSRNGGSGAGGWTTSSEMSSGGGANWGSSGAASRGYCGPRHGAGAQSGGATAKRAGDSGRPQQQQQNSGKDEWW